VTFISSNAACATSVTEGNSSIQSGGGLGVCASDYEIVHDLFFEVSLYGSYDTVPTRRRTRRATTA
jgi:hypothetical protein